MRDVHRKLVDSEGYLVSKDSGMLSGWVIALRNMFKKYLSLVSVSIDMGVSKNRGTPKWMV